MYKGNWKNGKPDGVGEMLYSNGTKQSGLFMNGNHLKIWDKKM